MADLAIGYKGLRKGGMTRDMFVSDLRVKGRGLLIGPIA